MYLLHKTPGKNMERRWSITALKGVNYIPQDVIVDVVSDVITYLLKKSVPLTKIKFGRNL